MSMYHTLTEQYYHSPTTCKHRLSQMEILFAQYSWKDFVSIKLLSINNTLTHHSLCPARRGLTVYLQSMKTRLLLLEYIL